MRLPQITAVLALAACCVAMPLSAHATDSPPIVDEVRIEGNQRVETDPILLHVMQEPDQPFDETLVDEDLKSIYGMGFFTSVRAKLEKDGDETVLVYTVRERPEVSQVRIDGMTAFSTTDSRIVHAVELHKGYILDPIAVEETVRNLKGVYEDNGYIDARVSFSAHSRRDNTVIAVFKVVETAEQ